MPFVKLDCNILRSTLWFERLQREIFITALLMAEPMFVDEPLPQIKVRSLESTGWSVPPDKETPYGFVAAAGVGIVRLAMANDSDMEAGLDALEKLGEPEESSRTPDFDGRRLVRVNGGYVVLNYGKYRERDYTAAERQKRWRERHKNNGVTPPSNGVTSRYSNVTSRKQKQSTEADKSTPQPPKGESVSDGFDLFWSEYPNKQAKIPAKRAWLKIHKDEREEVMRGLALWKRSQSWLKDDGQFIPHPATFLNQRRWEDSPKAKAIKPKVVYGRPLPPQNHNVSDADFKRASEVAKREMEALRLKLKTT